MCLDGLHILASACLQQMPKIQKSNTSKINSTIALYPGEFGSTPQGELYCNLCSVVVSHAKRFLVDSHRNTAKHQRGLPQRVNIHAQQFLDCTTKDFAMNVLEAFLSADIPLWKLRNNKLKKLFQSIGHPLPAEQTAVQELTNCTRQKWKKSNSMFKKSRRS